MGADMLILAVSVNPPGKPLDWAAGEARIKELEEQPFTAWPEDLVCCEVGEASPEAMESVDRRRVITMLR